MGGGGGGGGLDGDREKMTKITFQGVAAQQLSGGPVF